ncbi:MAG: hypothetical protein VKK59_01005 [Vampirovibrionales bacterium]|nr:hypothetical protein [Vampirovibrionales bacterium]
MFLVVDCQPRYPLIKRASAGRSRLSGFIGVLIVVGVVYQLFFRYEHWRGGQDNLQLFERDGFTGAVRRIEPNTTVNWLDRLLGKPSQPVDIKSSSPAESPSAIEKPTAKPSDKLHRKTPTASTTTSAVETALDLNRDGQNEQRIETPVAGQSAHLMDVSIVTTDGRELFYGRGSRLSVLPEQTAGWFDLLLEKPGSAPHQYRYNPNSRTYEAAL